MADEDGLLLTAVPAAVTVTVPIVVGEEQVALVPHSYIVIVGLLIQENKNADPVMLSTVLAFEILLYPPMVLLTEVNGPGW
jgi:hypothetical protein